MRGPAQPRLERRPYPRDLALPRFHRAARSRFAAWALCGALLPLGCGTSTETPSAATTQPVPTIEAELVRVQARSWPTIVRSQGNLVADEVAVVGAKVAGRVAEVHVDLGDFVRAGKPLAHLDQSEFLLEVAQAEAQLAQARSAVGLKPGDPVDQLDPESSPPVRQEQATWDEAKANLDRSTRLQTQGAITDSEYDQFVAAERVAEARYASALNSVHEKIALVGVREAELSLARDRLLDATIPAPFDALVQQRHVAPGVYVDVGDAVATMVRANPLRFQGTIPERHAQRLALGQEVRLKIESIAEPRTVRITRISPALDRLSRSLLFEAEVDNSDRRLRTGLFAEAEVVLDPDAEVLVVPASAVVEFAGAEKVWKVVDGRAAEQEVLTGGRRGEGIEIIEGLVTGDLILQDAAGGRIAKVQPMNDPALEAQPERRAQVADDRHGARDESLPPSAASE